MISQRAPVSFDEDEIRGDGEQVEGRRRGELFVHLTRGSEREGGGDEVMMRP